MEHETRNGIIAVLLVAAVAFLVIAGSGIVTGERWYNIKVDEGAAAENQETAQNQGLTGNQEPAQNQGLLEELDVSGHPDIREARRYAAGSGETQGYEVTVLAEGYGGPVTMKVEFDASGRTVLGLHILEHTETQGVGSKIADTEYVKQFIGVKAPVVSARDMEQFPLTDGTYEAKADKPQDGYTDLMTMTVEGGRITKVTWDSMGEDGNGKRRLSEIGEYRMTEEGATWAEQADALAAALMEHQTLEFLGYDEAGKTDAVAGVSISVNGFVHMAKDCLVQAGAGQTPVDGISGATVSSSAVVKGINRAAGFLQEDAA